MQFLSRNSLRLFFYVLATISSHTFSSSLCPSNSDKILPSTNCDCLAGYTLNDTLSNLCTQCTQGTFKELLGNHSCVLCPKHSSSYLTHCQCLPGFNYISNCGRPKLQGPMPINMDLVKESTDQKTVSFVELIPSGVKEFYVRFWIQSGSTQNSFDYRIQIHESNNDVFRSNVLKYDGNMTNTIMNIPNKRNAFDQLSRNTNTSQKWNGWNSEKIYRSSILITVNDVTISTVQCTLNKAPAPTQIFLCQKDSLTQLCNTFAKRLGLIRVYWEVDSRGHISAGYTNNVPPIPYGIDYFRVEVFSTQSLHCMIANQTCFKNKESSLCNFNKRIAQINSLPELDNYYIRVVSGTVIGDGIFSTISIADTRHIHHKLLPVLEFPCVACYPGSYKSIHGMGSCIDCLEGKYQGDFGSSFCQDCGVGKFSNLTGNNAEGNCQACPMGKYQGTFAAQLCIDCEAGKYNNVVGSEQCKTCPPNSQSKIIGSTQCSCNKGYFGVYGSVDCLLCPIGKYGQYEASMMCTDCPRGKYLDVMGSINELNCTMCLENSNTVVSGSKMCECNKGFSLLDVAGTCVKCSRGKYKTDFGSNLCTGCPRGKFLETRGSTTPLDCNMCHSNESISALASARKESCTSTSEKNYLITVKFNSNLDKSLITSEMLNNFFHKMSHELDVDLSRTRSLPFGGNALETNISFSITSVSQKESQSITNDISLEMLNAILLSSSETLWVSTFLQVQSTPVIGPPHASNSLSILILIFIGGGSSIVVIVIVVIICLCKKKNTLIKRVEYGTGYCVACSGSYEEIGYYLDRMI